MNSHIHSARKLKQDLMGFIFSDFSESNLFKSREESSKDFVQEPSKECTIVCPPPPVASVPTTQCGMTGADVEMMIRAAIAQYDADKTGKPDLALESAGGSVVSTRCTKKSNHVGSQVSIWNIPIWYPSNTPRKAIQVTKVVLLDDAN